MKTRPYHYCIMQVGKDPKIIEVQGLTWFETEDLAYQYWGFMNDEFQKKIGAISVISEENLLHQHQLLCLVNSPASNFTKYTPLG